MDSFNGKDILNEPEVDSLRKFLISTKKLENIDEISIFLINILPILIKTLQNADDSGKLRILTTDSLAIWILRATQLSNKSSAFKSEIPTVLDNNTIDYIYKFIIDYWDETGAPLSNSLKDVFNKLIILQKSGHEYKELFKSWIIQALQIKQERRVKYYLIETLSKDIEGKFILEKDPLFITNSLKLINSNSLGNPIGKALSSIYKKLYQNEDEADSWFNLYWKPVLSELKSGNKGIEQHLLPNLFKLSPKAFKLTIEEIKNNNELFITCLNIGQQLNLDEGVLTKTDIERLIVKEEYKVKVFQLLTYSSKGSKQIGIDTFDIIKQYLELFIVDVEVETRDEFIALFKQFIYRLKDSSYSLKRDGDKLLKSDKYKEESVVKFGMINIYKSFMSWLANFLKSQLKPGYQYSRIISSLKILRQLVESNLDPNIKNKFTVQLPYAFNISIYDDEFIDLLLGNILSTYDDIRTESISLLMNYDIEYRQNIIDLGFEMLEDYGKSDSGAKLLELSFVLFKDMKIFNRLIDEIPLIEEINIAVKHPIDGYFNSIALILKHLTPTEIPEERLFEIILKNWNIVKEILSNDSPEGCDQYGVGSAQLVLSYGWRCTKESTLVVQQLLNHKLETDLIIKIGELTMDQLSTVRHRGAFSSVYPTFIKLISSIQKEQVEIWLDDIFNLIQTKTQLITRRSGGLPFLISAILTVYHDLFPKCFDQLMEIAKRPINSDLNESEKMDLPQIHAFNCIKQIFIESQLSSLCSPFIYQALDLSLSSFSSEIWSVRNCSIMLFNALQNRLFGKKKMSAGVFFTRFKGLREILLDILKNFVQNDNLEILFPVLTILSKLEASPGYDGLDEFKPLLRSCLGVKYWKIRESASRALISLISEPVEESLYLWSKVSIKDQNQLHGFLLVIKELGGLSSEQILERFHELLLVNPSYVTAKVYLEILNRFVVVKPNDELTSLFNNEINIKSVDGSKQLYLKELFESLEKSQEVLSNSLSSFHFEVKLSAINYCSINAISHPLLSTIVNNRDEWSYIRSKSFRLVNNISISDAFQYVNNQDIYGEDLKCSAFEFLGLVLKSTTPEFNDWVNKLIQLSNDDEPFTIRIAALKSALNFLLREENIDIKWIVYKFLTDDDDEIRSIASDYFEQDIVPWVSSIRFISPEYEPLAIKEILSFKPQFDSSQHIKELFSVEKKNFYRIGVEQSLQLTQFITNNCNQQVILHLSEVKESLITFLENTKLRLNWSIDDILFEQIYITIHYLKFYNIELSTIKQLTKSLDIHRTLLNQLEN